MRPRLCLDRAAYVRLSRVPDGLRFPSDARSEPLGSSFFGSREFFTAADEMIWFFFSLSFRLAGSGIVVLLGRSVGMDPGDVGI